MKCIILDDERLAIDVIRTHVERIPYLEIVGETTDAFEAINLLSTQKIDLLFLDIQMPTLTGIELLKSLEKIPMVIFTTAYPEFALESYEYNAVDYLVKPIPFERFLKAVNKANSLFKLDDSKGVALSPDTESEIIFVKTEYKTIRINLNNIHYVESKKDYVIFHLENESIRSILSMKSVEEQLPTKHFLRIHRSFIIAINKINEIERNTVLMKEDRLSVGSNYRSLFKEVIEKRRLN